MRGVVRLVSVRGWRARTPVSDRPRCRPLPLAGPRRSLPSARRVGPLSRLRGTCSERGPLPQDPRGHRARDHQQAAPAERLHAPDGAGDELVRACAAGSLSPPPHTLLEGGRSEYPPIRPSPLAVRPTTSLSLSLFGSPACVSSPLLAPGSVRPPVCSLSLSRSLTPGQVLRGRARRPGGRGRHTHRCRG